MLTQRCVDVVIIVMSIIASIWHVLNVGVDGSNDGLQWCGGCASHHGDRLG